MSQENLKYKTKKGVYWTFFNQFANNGLQFVVGIIMARMLTPSDYGITALPMVFMVVANVFIESGFSGALVRKQNITEEDLSTAFYYSISIGILCYLFLFLSAGWIADFYNEPVLVPLIRVTALSFLWSPLVTPQNILLQRKLDFKTPARIAITTKFIGAVIGISLAYFGYGLWSLVAMGVVSSLLTFIQTWLAVKWLPKTKWSKESFRYLWGYGNKMLASALLDRIYSNITTIIVGKFYSTAELGIYNRAYGYASLPAVQSTNIIQNVTFPILSKLQTDDTMLSEAYRRIIKSTAFVVFPMMMLLAALAKPFIILLISEKWIESVLLLQLLCFSMMWFPIHAINLNLLQVKGRPDLFLKLEIWKKCIGLGIMACTLSYGLVYFIAAGILSSFVMLMINTYYTDKIINLGFVMQMKDLLPSYVLSILTFTIIIIVNQFIESLWLQLIVGLCIGIAFYFGIAFILKFQELKDLKYMINYKQ